MNLLSEKNQLIDINKFLLNFTFKDNENLFDLGNETKIEYLNIDNYKIPKYINEFWTSKQRKANSIHEISYRACFKPQLPNFFINLLTNENDIVYDPFNGRGTTIIEAGLLNRNIIANDINPLSIILSKARFFIPNIDDLKERLNKIEIKDNLKTDIELDMFYHKKTLNEILSLKNYLINKKNNNLEDKIDLWIRMIATNRLTGHSKGFFSVYTLPPNQATSRERQVKINKDRNQIPEYRNTKEIIINKTLDLIKDINSENIFNLNKIGRNGLFLNSNSTNTPEIKSNSVQLVVTSPPFLDIVQYDEDNWLRCWFNDIDINEISKKITMSKKVDDWCNVMQDVFNELYRIIQINGWVAFEVGEVRNGKIKLDEYVVKLGIMAGFSCEAIMINEQVFTKTANIWGIKNNESGTNSNRIVIFRKR